MKFSELAKYFDQLEVTSSRNELVRILAELYKKVSPEEIQPVTYLIQGRVAPFFEPTEIGMGEKLVISALAKAFRTDKEEVARKFSHLGDLGLVAEEMSQSHREKRIDLPVWEVFKALETVAKTMGQGTVEKKVGGLADLVEHLDPISAKHLVRIPSGNLRLGIGDPTVLDALSFAKKGDKSLRPTLEAAYNRTSDLGLVAKTFWAEGELALGKIKIEVGKPVRPELAERLPNPEAVIKKLGFIGVQPKYDGFRVQ